MPTPRLTALLLTAVVGAATLVGLAGPASAAASIEITPTVKNAVVGEPFDVSWTSSPEIESVVASGDWADPAPTELSGTQTITPRAPGDLTFTLTGQVAGGGQPVVQTLTVTVAAAPREVTPVAPTYPDACSITIPDVEGVDYVSMFEGESEVLDPDTYPTFLFSDEFLGTDVELTARAQDGFVLAAGSPTRFEVRVDPTCEPQLADLVRTTSACRTVRFTSAADEPVTVFYGDVDSDDADGTLRLLPGASGSVDVTTSVLGYAAVNDAGLALTNDDEDAPLPPDVRFEADSVRVQLDCGHPTVAPAAGR